MGGGACPRSLSHHDAYTSLAPPDDDAALVIEIQLLVVHSRCRGTVGAAKRCNVETALRSITNGTQRQAKSALTAGGGQQLDSVIVVKLLP
jgi:hypothetical protein